VKEDHQRLQKILAVAGYGSRRACEEIIRQGRVSVNGRQARLGESADPARDTISVDGTGIHLEPTHKYIVVYKPTGIISTLSDELGRKTVRDLVPVEGHLVPVGRLDADSEGLVLLTDDGDLTNLLTHPRYEHDKEYHVYVTGHPDEPTLERWRRGVDLPDLDAQTRDGGRTAPAQVEVMRVRGNSRSRSDGTWLRVILHEGRKRQIRRVAGLLGHPVRQLVRVRIGPLKLGDLKPGQWRVITRQELENLKSQIPNFKQVSNPKHSPGHSSRNARPAPRNSPSKIKNPIPKIPGRRRP
jgi:pseudouridine synthase